MRSYRYVWLRLRDSKGGRPKSGVCCHLFIVAATSAVSGIAAVANPPRLSVRSKRRRTALRSATLSSTSRRSNTAVDCRRSRTRKLRSHDADADLRWFASHHGKEPPTGIRGRTNLAAAALYRIWKRSTSGFHASICLPGCGSSRPTTRSTRPVQCPFQRGTGEGHLRHHRSFPPGGSSTDAWLQLGRLYRRLLAICRFS